MPKYIVFYPEQISTLFPVTIIVKSYYPLHFTVFILILIAISHNQPTFILFKSRRKLQLTMIYVSTPFALIINLFAHFISDGFSFPKDLPVHLEAVPYKRNAIKEDTLLLLLLWRVKSIFHSVHYWRSQRPKQSHLSTSDWTGSVGWVLDNHHSSGLWMQLSWSRWAAGSWVRAGSTSQLGGGLQRWQYGRSGGNTWQILFYAGFVPVSVYICFLIRHRAYRPAVLWQEFFV